MGALFIQPFNINIHDLSNFIYEDLINHGIESPLPDRIYNKIQFIWDSLVDEFAQHIRILEDYFEEYIIYYINKISIFDFINGNATFGRIAFNSNQMHADNIRGQMIEEGIEIECRCGVGQPHTYGMHKGYEGFCNNNTYVKLVYDGCIIKNPGFIKHQGPFLPGQCYARRVLLIHNGDHYVSEPIEDQHYYWDDIKSYPTCPYNPLQPEWANANNVFHVLGPSHASLLEDLLNNIQEE